MSRSDDHSNTLLVAFAALLLIGCVAYWVVSSGFEAETFNRLTGGHATTWDAMWTELRVIGSERPNG